MSLRFFHCADLHVQGRFDSWRALFDKRVLGLINSRLIRSCNYDPHHIESFVRTALEERPDAIVFAGDAVSTASPREFRAAFDALIPLVESDIPLLYTPGNHDAYVRDWACRTALEHFISELSRQRRTRTDFPFLETVSGVRFLLLDCARPTSWLFSNGRVSERTLEFLRETTRTPSAPDSPLVCVCHFPVLNTRSARHWRRGLENAEPLRALLRNGKIDLLLCGHVHTPFDALDDAGHGEICAGSLGLKGVFSEIRYSGGETNRFTLVRRHV